MAMALCVTENGRSIHAIDVKCDEGEREQQSVETVALVEAIRDKYCQVREFYDADVPSALRIIRESARSSKPGVTPVEKVTSMIIEKKAIADSGPKEVLASLCSSLTELHLGGNLIASWAPVSTILSAMPTLQVLDLANNKTLREASDPVLPLEPHRSLRVLVLSCTSVPFNSIVTVMERLPCLEELHLSKNSYSNHMIYTQDSMQPHTALTKLLLAENDITEWATVEVLSSYFPNLDYLMLNSNPLANITPGNGSFPRLRELHLNKTRIASWSCVESLAQLPALSSLSILHVPMKGRLNEEKARHAVVARLPSLVLLNKSKISNEERERAERWLIREYQDKEERPATYQNLVDKHGQLKPLTDIDLSPKHQVSVEFSYDGLDKRNEIHTINLKQTVRQLKGWMGRRLGVPPSKVSLYHIDNGVAHYFAELTGDSRGLHAFGINDGDTMKVVIRI